MNLAESSPQESVAEEVATPQAEAGGPDVSAESSPAENSGVKTLLDVINATAPKSGEDSPSSEQGQDAKATEAPADKAKKEPREDLGGLTDEEFAQAGRGAQQRIRQLVSESKALKAEVEPLRQKAEGLDAFVNLAESNNLTPEDVNNIFEIGALVKNDPHKALSRIAEIYNQLAAITGAVLPADLQEQVRLGAITEEHARALAKSQADAALANARATKADEKRRRDAEQAETDRKAEELKDRAETVARAITDWESAKSKNDPDWKLKQARVVEAMELRVRRSQFPESANQAVEWAEEELKRVEQELRKYRPAPQARTPVTGSALPRATPAPKSYLDVVKMHSGG